MAGFRFLFVDLMNETEALKNIGEDFLDPGTTWTLDELKSDLDNISRVRGKRCLSFGTQTFADESK